VPIAEVNGTRLAWEMVGEGEPVALLNGVMMTMASWGLESRVLSRSHRVLLHDFRGQLRSDRPPGPYSLALHADDFAALLDHLSIDSIHLVGTSYGGEVAMEFAIAHPERVHSLTVIASVSEVGRELREKIERWIAIARTDRARLFEETVSDNYSAAFIEENPAFVAAAAERLSALDDDWFRALADLCASFQTLDLTPRLAAIARPTLVIAAELDALKPLAYAELIASRIPHAELRVIEGAGHAVVIERAAEINEAVSGFIHRVSVRA
jgi:3-oxoadipate enol-lactonase